MTQKKQNFNTTTMLNRIRDWDFNPKQLATGYLEYKPGTLTINPISLIASNVDVTDLQKIVEANMHAEFDILENGSYPIFDGDSHHLLCGNRAVAAALVEAGIAQLAEKPVKYPVYYQASATN